MKYIVINLKEAKKVGLDADTLVFLTLQVAQSKIVNREVGDMGSGKRPFFRHRWITAPYMGFDFEKKSASRYYNRILEQAAKAGQLIHFEHTERSTNKDKAGYIPVGKVFDVSNTAPTAAETDPDVLYLERAIYLNAHGYLRSVREYFQG